MEPASTNAVVVASQSRTYHPCLSRPCHSSHATSSVTHDRGQWIIYPSHIRSPLYSFLLINCIPFIWIVVACFPWSIPFILRSFLYLSLAYSSTPTVYVLTFNVRDVSFNLGPCVLWTTACPQPRYLRAMIVCLIIWSRGLTFEEHHMDWGTHT